MVVTKGCSLMRWTTFFIWLSTSCAPTLSGQLQGSSGQPFGPDARVNITPLIEPVMPKDSASNQTLVLKVQPDGKFSTDAKLPPGDCLIEALVPGYSLASIHVNIDSKNRVELKLRPLPPTSLRATQLPNGQQDSRGSGSANLAPPSM